MGHIWSAAALCCHGVFWHLTLSGDSVAGQQEGVLDTDWEIEGGWTNRLSSMVAHPGKEA